MTDWEVNKKWNQMDKQLFRENLLKTIDELIPIQTQSDTFFRFIVTINEEISKKHNSDDDLMRLVVFNNYNMPQKIIELDDVIDLLAHPRVRFPLWINVSVEEFKEHSIIFKLESSSRFRKPSQLQNKETNHPPFKAVF
ncbi:hypothetical protein [Flavobacterium branchiicola]|uniref:Uncharacterized protein n=1 Tax=Flavobacterium branchiicola TaxID=1114875 RepID=A0ABV9PFE2_9FLAO|nr:hypothetical protein [Flavobacterium branchiicola]MBS7254206.1 hypothetical protein [Flavobacterium branchiicola]